MRHDGPNLTNSLGNRIVPRTLLQTVTVTGPVTDVTLVLPATPYKRFHVEIDNWGSTGDGVFGRVRAQMNGLVRLGAAEYSYHTDGYPSTTGSTHSSDNVADSIWITRSNAGWGFGSGPDEAYSFTFEIDPGVDSTNLPKIWWRGVGISDTNIMVGYNGFGVYRGKTSLEFGRMEALQFTVSLDSIKEGEFRLYGTE